MKKIVSVFVGLAMCGITLAEDIAHPVVFKDDVNFDAGAVVRIKGTKLTATATQLNNAGSGILNGATITDSSINGTTTDTSTNNMSGVVNLTGTTTMKNGTLQGTLTMNGTNNLSGVNTITGTTELKNGTLHGTLTMDGTNSISGVTTITGATIVNPTVNGTVTLAGTNNLTGINKVGGFLAWSGVVTNNGAGLTNYLWVGQGIITNVTYVGTP